MLWWFNRIPLIYIYCHLSFAFLFWKYLATMLIKLCWIPMVKWSILKFVIQEEARRNWYFDFTEFGKLHCSSTGGFYYFIIVGNTCNRVFCTFFLRVLINEANLKQFSKSNSNIQLSEEISWSMTLLSLLEEYVWPLKWNKKGSLFNVAS